MLRKRMGAGVCVLCAATLLASCARESDTAWTYWDASNEAGERRLDHGSWNRFLQRYVLEDASGVNKVRYADVTPESRRELASYLAQLSAVDPRELPRVAQLAYWMNLYNALTVEVVLRHPEAASIMDMGSGGSGPWRDELLSIAEQRLSLDDIEHRILRPLWRDPRIHYGINCASISCPNLLPVAYTADNVDALLDDAETAYINHPRAVSIGEGGRPTLSSIFDWYLGDFAPDERGLLAYLSRHHALHAEALADYRGAIRYEYDWSLNAASN